MVGPPRRPHRGLPAVPYALLPPGYTWCRPREPPSSCACALPWSRTSRTSGSGGSTTTRL
eukprot:9831539-Alexandrium_andersonii.AAC.1